MDGDQQQNDKVLLLVTVLVEILLPWSSSSMAEFQPGTRDDAPWPDFARELVKADG